MTRSRMNLARNGVIGRPLCRPRLHRSRLRAAASFNPHFDRLSLFVCRYKSFVINCLHQYNKLNYKKESIRKVTPRLQTQSVKAELSTVLRPNFRSFSGEFRGEMDRPRSAWMEEWRSRGRVPFLAQTRACWPRGKFRMDTRPPCLRRIPRWVQRLPSR
jgi:hypothetical protein